MSNPQDKRQGHEPVQHVPPQQHPTHPSRDSGGAVGGQVDLSSTLVGGVGLDYEPPAAPHAAPAHAAPPAVDPLPAETRPADPLGQTLLGVGDHPQAKSLERIMAKYENVQGGTKSTLRGVSNEASPAPKVRTPPRGAPAAKVRPAAGAPPRPPTPQPTATQAQHSSASPPPLPARRGETSGQRPPPLPNQRRANRQAAAQTQAGAHAQSAAYANGPPPTPSPGGSVAAAPPGYKAGAIPGTPQPTAGAAQRGSSPPPRRTDGPTDPDASFAPTPQNASAEANVVPTPEQALERISDTPAGRLRTPLPKSMPSGAPQRRMDGPSDPAAVLATQAKAPDVATSDTHPAPVGESAHEPPPPMRDRIPSDRPTDRGQTPSQRRQARASRAATEQAPESIDPLDLMDGEDLLDGKTAEVAADDPLFDRVQSSRAIPLVQQHAHQPTTTSGQPTTTSAQATTTSGQASPPRGSWGPAPPQTDPSSAPPPASPSPAPASSHAEDRRMLEAVQGLAEARAQRIRELELLIEKERRSARGALHQAEEQIAKLQLNARRGEATAERLRDALANQQAHIDELNTTIAENHAKRHDEREGSAAENADPQEMEALQAKLLAAEESNQRLSAQLLEVQQEQAKGLERHKLLLTQHGELADQLAAARVEAEEAKEALLVQQSPQQQRLRESSELRVLRLQLDKLHRGQSEKERQYKKQIRTLKESLVEAQDNAQAQHEATALLHQQERTMLREQLEDLQAQHAKLQREHRDKPASTPPANAETLPVAADPAGKPTADEQQADEKPTTPANPEAAQAELQLQEPEPTPADAPPDDLTRLKGIGAVFCKRLYAIGVTRFVQIANWTDADIKARSAELKIPSSRILKNEWIAQAKAIVAESDTTSHG